MNTNDPHSFEDLSDDELALVADALTPIAPGPARRQALLDALEPRGRLARFAAEIARMIDVSLEHAERILTRVFDPDVWEPGPIAGSTTLWVEGGPAVAGCIRGFLRIEAGLDFPHHQHLGDEEVLVLEGAMIDSTGAMIRPGQRFTMRVGTEHSYRSQPGGAELLTFLVVRDGVRVGDAELRHRD
ncbi:MAG: cupin domain-containing protein [Deltaproteobacteria bacterium]|nr:cupin domain-containing protein [Deltaproteobacteria bacterium]